MIEVSVFQETIPQQWLIWKQKSQKIGKTYVVLIVYVLHLYTLISHNITVHLHLRLTKGQSVQNLQKSLLEKTVGYEGKAAEHPVPHSLLHTGTSRQKAQGC